MSTTISSVSSFGIPGDEDGPARPAPRRTYGKRAVTPPNDDEPSRSLFTTITSDSPSKTLLNRWSDKGKDWRASLADLGSDPPSDLPSSDPPMPGPSGSRSKLTNFGRSRLASQDEEDEDDVELDDEELKKQMERMRRQARGLDVTTDEPQDHSVGSIRQDRTVPDARKLVPFSSTLTTLPSSDLPVPERSSPPIFSEGASWTERSSTAEIIPEPKNRKMAVSPRGEASPSDSEEGDRTLRRGSPSRSQSPPLFSDPGRPPSIRGGTAGPDPADEPLPSMDKFWADVTGEAEADVETDVNAVSLSPKEAVASKASGLFDDDEDNEPPKPVKIKKPKPLSKKDMRLMQSGLAEGRRNRAVEVHKVGGSYLPLSTWMLEAVRVLGAQTNASREEGSHGLAFGAGSSPNTSPSRKTLADDIVAFTPSSDNHRAARAQAMNQSTTSLGEPASSPTPATGRTAHPRTVVPSTSDAAEGDHDQLLRSVDDIFDQEVARQAEAQKRKERIAALTAAKAAALQRRPAVAKQVNEEDEDFEIVREVTPGPSSSSVRIKTESTRRGPDAKAILNRNTSSTSPQLSRHKQVIMRHAGKGGRAKDSLTDSFVDFAGKAFDHAGMLRRNAGAIPPGQKTGREAALSPAQLDALMRKNHLQQAEMVRRKKEEAWGRVKPLPMKQKPDIEALVAATAKQVHEDENSEDEDDDFVPDDEEQDGEGDEEDDSRQYSGEEDEGSQAEDIEPDEGQQVEAQESEDDGDASDAKSTTPTLQAMEAPTDVADATPRPSNHRLMTASSSNSTLPSDGRDRDVSQGSLDMGGFGDGDGGFSQLFEATQTSEGPQDTDVFAGLRGADAVNLLQADAYLPNNNISETQAARDNALIAGEIEAAAETQQGNTQPKTLYLNDNGKLTQTKPDSEFGSRSNESQWAALRKKLAGPSDLLSDITESPQQRMLSSTEKGTSQIAPQTSSPTEQKHRMNRPGRDSSPEDDETRSLIPSIPAKRHEEDAFARMMRQARRAEARKAAIKSNLVDNQAEESDEDGGWAPNGEKDDEDDEDLDEGYVPDLVDDAAIDEEEKKRQDELAAAKLREIQQADDAKREAEARKITEGQYRTKKRGVDFFSDEENDEDGGGKRRWSKKERRKRRLDREDGLEKLEGEANAFKAHYDAGLESDFSEDEPEAELPLNLPPVEESLEDARPAWLILRERAAKNRGKDLAKQDDELDKELGLNGASFTESMDVDEDEVVVEEESQFSISRSIRSSASINLDDDKHGGRKLSVQRSTDSYAQFVRDESQLNRRMTGSAGVSVVVKKNTGPTATRIGGPGPSRAPSRKSTSSSTGSVLLSKGNRFG